jgi:hypothetical protein
VPSPDADGSSFEDCPVCCFSKTTQAQKGKTMDTELLSPVELLHIDFAFWDIISHRGFNAILMIIDAKTQNL